MTSTPETATPETIQVFGHLSAEEIQQITSIKNSYDEILRALGELKMREAHLTKQGNVLDEAASNLLKEVAQRIGVGPDLSGYAIRNDGSVIKV